MDKKDSNKATNKKGLVVALVLLLVVTAVGVAYFFSDVTLFQGNISKTVDNTSATQYRDLSDLAIVSDNYRIAPADIFTNDDKLLRDSNVTMFDCQDFLNDLGDEPELMRFILTYGDAQYPGRDIAGDIEQFYYVVDMIENCLPGYLADVLDEANDNQCTTAYDNLGDVYEYRNSNTDRLENCPVDFYYGHSMTCSELEAELRNATRSTDRGRIIQAMQENGCSDCFIAYQNFQAVVDNARIEYDAARAYYLDQLAECPAYADFVDTNMTDDTTSIDDNFDCNFKFASYGDPYNYDYNFTNVLNCPVPTEYTSMSCADLAEAMAEADTTTERGKIKYALKGLGCSDCAAAIIGLGLLDNPQNRNHEAATAAYVAEIDSLSCNFSFAPAGSNLTCQDYFDLISSTDNPVALGEYRYRMNELNCLGITTAY